MFHFPQPTCDRGISGGCLCHLADGAQVASPAFEKSLRPKPVAWLKSNESRPVCRSAFSLVELMIVLAILVTITAIAVPNLRRSFQKNSIQDAARQLQEELGKLRIQAIESGTPIFVQLGWGSSQIRVFRVPKLEINRDSQTPQNQPSLTGGQNSNQSLLATLNSIQNLSSEDATEEWLIEIVTLPFNATLEEKSVAQTLPTSGPAETNLESVIDTGNSQFQTQRFDNTGNNSLPSSTSSDESISARWSTMIAFLPNGSAQEIDFWLQLDQRWQCPALLRSASGQLQIGPIRQVDQTTASMSGENLQTTDAIKAFDQGTANQ